MSKDYIGYEALTDAALRGVVREALRIAGTKGLVGSHHFYVTFRTHFPGVDIPDFLREQYPEEMTIVLQHQFWGLRVEEDHFEVTLTFRKVPAELVIPFAALTGFVDPGTQFGLQFKTEGGAGPSLATGPMNASADAPTPLPTAGRDEGAVGDTDADMEAEDDEAPPPAPGEVVNLDAFRKK